MFGHHFVLALLVSYSSNFASTHIVTSAHADLTFAKCVKSLTAMVQTTLCPIYGQMAEYPMETEMESRSSWQFTDNIKRCCSRPCSVAELVAFC